MKCNVLSKKRKNSLSEKKILEEKNKNKSKTQRKMEDSGESQNQFIPPQYQQK